MPGVQEVISTLEVTRSLKRNKGAPALKVEVCSWFNHRFYYSYMILSPLETSFGLHSKRNVAYCSKRERDSCWCLQVRYVECGLVLLSMHERNRAHGRCVTLCDLDYSFAAGLWRLWIVLWSQLLLVLYHLNISLATPRTDGAQTRYTDPKLHTLKVCFIPHERCIAADM